MNENILNKSRKILNESGLDEAIKFIEQSGLSEIESARLKTGISYIASDFERAYKYALEFKGLAPDDDVSINYTMAIVALSTDRPELALVLCRALVESERKQNSVYFGGSLNLLESYSSYLLKDYDAAIKALDAITDETDTYPPSIRGEQISADRLRRLIERARGQEEA